MKKNEMTWDLRSCNTKIYATLCGTAGEKTICLKSNCEMTMPDIEKVISRLLEAEIFLKSAEKDCDICPDNSACPDRKVER